MNYSNAVNAAFGDAQMPTTTNVGAPPGYSSAVSSAFSNFKTASHDLINADQPIEEDSTPFSYGVGAANKWVGDELEKGARWLGVSDPASLRDISNLPTAVETVLGARISPPQRFEEVPAAVPHSLADAAQAESQRLDAMRAQAQSAGLELPERAISQPQQVANDLARQDLQLPTVRANGVEAPLTSQMLHAANKQFVSPAYQAVEKYPTPIKLSDATKATLEDVAPLMPPKEAATLPTGNAITGQQAVNLSKALRAKANQFPDIGVNASNQTWSSIAQAHVDAARSIENDVRTQLTADGNGQLADDWDAARIYRAKSGAYEQALDGAGNVRVPDLKRQLFKAGVPLSDNAEMLANIGAQYPEMWKTSPAAAPKPGIVKSALANVAPPVLAAGGAASPLGPLLGSAVGAEVGQRIASRLLKKKP